MRCNAPVFSGVLLYWCGASPAVPVLLCASWKLHRQDNRRVRSIRSEQGAARQSPLESLLLLPAPRLSPSEPESLEAAALGVACVLLCSVVCCFVAVRCVMYRIQEPAQNAILIV